jgi:hypothetical protein
MNTDPTAKSTIDYNVVDSTAFEIADAPCTKCGEVADDGFDGMCIDCYRGEHGPPDSYWEGRDNSGPYEPPGYRQNMIDAGRGHLLG